MQNVCLFVEWGKVVKCTSKTGFAESKALVGRLNANCTINRINAKVNQKKKTKLNSDRLSKER